MVGNGPVVEIEVAYTPAHYNPRCACNIPAYWRADVLSGVPRIDNPPSGSHQMLYRDGDTRDEVVADIIEAVKAEGVSHGRIRIV